jgi:hypothetical protein
MDNSDFEFKFYTGYFTRIFLQFLASNYTIRWKSLNLITFRCVPLSPAAYLPIIQRLNAIPSFMTSSTSAPVSSTLA